MAVVFVLLMGQDHGVLLLLLMLGKSGHADMLMLLLLSALFLGPAGASSHTGLALTAEGGRPILGRAFAPGRVGRQNTRKRYLPPVSATHKTSRRW